MPEERVVEQFAEQLRMLQAEAGNPSLGEIVQRDSKRQLAKATLSDHLSGRRKGLPNARFVTAYYQACLDYAQSIGRGTERLGTLDEWMDLLTAANRGELPSASPVRAATTVASVWPLAAEQPLAEPPDPEHALARPQVVAHFVWRRPRRLITVAGIVLAVAVIAGLLAFRPWRSSVAEGRRPPVTHSSASASVLGGLSWTYPTKDSVDGSPAIAGNTVYIADDSGYIYALNAHSGSLVWEKKASAQIDSTPCVANGMLYVGDDNGDFYAISTVTGQIRWQRNFPGGIDSSPALAHGVLYFGDGSNYVHAVSASNGSTIWAFQTGNTVTSSPVVDNGIVYVGSEDDNVYALTAGPSGQAHEIWVRHTGAPVDSSPVLAGGVLYIGSDDHRVYALQARTGTVIWTRSVNGKVVSKPFVTGGRVYLSSGDGAIYALSEQTGDVLWRREIGGPLGSSPYVYQGLIYVGSSVGNSDGSLYAIRTNGQIVRSYQTGAQVQSSPLAAGGRVYVGSENDEVLAVQVPGAAS